MRSVSISIDTRDLMRTLDNTDGVLQDGIISGAHDILNLWQAEARHGSPIDTGTLRKNIEQKLEQGAGLDVEMKLTSNAFRDEFNYAYYQHEVLGRKYLETSAKRVEPRMQTILENELRDAIKKAGW